MSHLKSAVAAATRFVAAQHLHLLDIFPSSRACEGAGVAEGILCHRGIRRDDQEEGENFHLVKRLFFCTSTARTWGVVRHDESNEAFEGNTSTAVWATAMRGAMHQGCSRFRSKIHILFFRAYA